MVVNDLNLLWSGRCPHEADPSLVGNPYAVLSRPTALQSFQPVPRRDPQVIEHRRRTYLAKLAQCRRMDPWIYGSHALPMPEALGCIVAKRSDHTHSV